MSPQDIPLSTTQASAEQASAEQASTLCVACGLCCNGMLHHKARLQHAEIPLAESLGMTVLEGEKLTFQLPCACWQQGKCSVYAQTRPATCGSYRCKLLRNLDREAVTLDAALEQVAQAKKLVAEIDAIIDNTLPHLSIWQRADKFAAAHDLKVDSVEFRRNHPQLAIKLATLHWLLERHFRRQKEAETQNTLHD